MVTSPVTPHGTEDIAPAEGLDPLRREGLRPVFAAVPHPQRLPARGMHVHPIGDDAIIALEGFSLAGKKRASIRHSVTSARRAGITVEPYGPRHADGTAAVSAH